MRTIVWLLFSCQPESFSFAGLDSLGHLLGPSNIFGVDWNSAELLVGTIAQQIPNASWHVWKAFVSSKVVDKTRSIPVCLARVDEQVWQFLVSDRWYAPVAVPVFEAVSIQIPWLAEASNHLPILTKKEGLVHSCLPTETWAWEVLADPVELSSLAVVSSKLFCNKRATHWILIRHDWILPMIHC